MMANAFDPDRISVWPNPYYGYNPEERDALDRRVMFSHLPEEGPATIRIFRTRWYLSKNNSPQ